MHKHIYASPRHSVTAEYDLKLFLFRVILSATCGIHKDPREILTRTRRWEILKNAIYIKVSIQNSVNNWKRTCRTILNSAPQILEIHFDFTQFKQMLLVSFQTYSEGLIQIHWYIFSLIFPTGTKMERNKQSPEKNITFIGGGDKRIAVCVFRQMTRYLHWRICTELWKVAL